ncbi:MAG: DUF3772 domain-containing protein [Paracoccaceae bacterium]
MASRHLTLIVAALLAALTALFVAAPLAAQDAPAVDYTLWERDAAQGEALLEQNRVTVAALEAMRTRIVDWRTRLQEAQSANESRIETVRSQIAALGPAPAEGATEAEEIATRRRALNEQLSRLQAPGLNAVEAYSRAESIVRQIDAKIRAQQADALLKLSPSPLNPINWPAGAAVLTQGSKTLAAEVSSAWADPVRRATLRNNLPVMLLYLVIAGVLMVRGPGFTERLTTRIQSRVSRRARQPVAAIVSLGQIAVPVAGMYLLVLAIEASGMTGQRSGALVSALPSAAFAFFAARWLGGWLFQQSGSHAQGDAASLFEGRRTEARFHANMIGLMTALETFRIAFVTEVRPPLSQAAQSVWAAPVAVLVAVFLLRIGLVLRRGQRLQAGAGEAVQFRARMVTLSGTALAAVAVLGMLLAAVGYVAAANAIIWPAVMTLGLCGFIIILQRFLTDLYLAITGAGEEGREALVPVLIGILLIVAALPFAALIWGARVADLSEMWTAFRAGIPLGSTRISPTAFLTLIVVFGIGFALTRLLQGAMKTSLLPRTSLDTGVRNAITAGVGYVGIFLAALIAITSAGIDLSSLAIVAGALSVGIGFGLQNIVQNFVSGIILLIERPVSEGDWIEVGGQQGIVKAISVRSTRIETFDRIDVIVPNGDLIAGQVKNWTRFSATGRIVVPMTLDFDVDTRRVSDILLEIAQAQPQVMLQPPPAVSFADLTLDGAKLELIAFVPDVTLGGAVKTEIRHRIMERFREEGIVTPGQARDVWIRNAGEVAAAFGQEASARPAPARKTKGKPDAGTDGEVAV